MDATSVPDYEFINNYNFPSAPPAYTLHSTDAHFEANKPIVKIQTSKDPTSPADDPSALSLMMMNIELDIKKARLKQEQLEKEKQIHDQDFEVRTALLGSEIGTALLKLESLKKSYAASTTGNVVSNQTPEERAPNSSRHLYPALPGQTGTGNETSNCAPSRPANVTVMSSAIYLDHLRMLDRVVIQPQRVRSDLEECYEVVSPVNNLVLFNVEVTYATVCSYSAVRLIFTEPEGNQVMVFQAGRDRFMELFIYDQLVALQRKEGKFKSKMIISDHISRPTMKIKWPANAKDKHRFIVSTVLDKKNVGFIDKSIEAPGAEPLTSIVFPAEMQLRYKAALIASNFLIMDVKTAELRKRKLATSQLSNRNTNRVDYTKPMYQH